MRFDSEPVPCRKMSTCKKARKGRLVSPSMSIQVSSDLVSSLARPQAATTTTAATMPSVTLPLAPHYQPASPTKSDRMYYPRATDLTSLAYQTGCRF